MRRHSRSTKQERLRLDVGLIFAGACSLVAALVGQIALAPAGLWLVAVLVMKVIVRSESTVFGQRLTDPEPRSPLRHLVSEACEGVIWGSSILILHPREQHYEIFVVLALCAVSIIGALSMSPSFLAAMPGPSTRRSERPSPTAGR